MNDRKENNVKKGDGNRLWIWGRRPSVLARFAHGGYNSAYPINDHTVIAQVYFKKIAEAEEKKEELRKASLPPQSSNVLQFSPPRLHGKSLTARRHDKISSRLSRRTNPNADSKSPVEKTPKKD